MLWSRWRSIAVSSSDHESTVDQPIDIREILKSGLYEFGGPVNDDLQKNVQIIQFGEEKKRDNIECNIPNEYAVY